ncbi:tetratricopeptide repeat protein [Actinomadura napierensis]|uniref:Tetratricopeptide repeat protein n=1 Tax=Actinomadura napierensis TaxID=267854 RepID=A0ABN2YZS6_9ACTN
MASAAALLVAAPGVLAAAGVKDWRLLTAAAVLVPLATLFAGVWKTRFEKDMQDRQTLDQELIKGTFTPGGKLPRVRDIIDPITMGVHPARRSETTLSTGSREPGQSGDRVPVYVLRDIDAELRRELGGGGFVLLVGDSAAGKTRAAFEAVRAMLPDHTLIVPENRDGVAAAVRRAATIRRCVLWLNDIHDYLGTGGLTRRQVAELLAGDEHHRVIVATLRAAEEDRLTAGGDDAEGRQVQRDSQAVLEQAHRIFVERRFSETEQNHARDLAVEDSRVADALEHADSYGIAEYLACGPQLLQEWERARIRGGHPRAAALVAAAVDVRRAGFTAPLPRELLAQLHTGYLDRDGGDRLRPETEEQAWQWATQFRESGNALLHAVTDDRYEVFDYLVDSVQRTTPAGDHVPESTIIQTLAHADAADAMNLADTASDQGRYRLAETALRQAVAANHDQHGPEHPSTLASRNNLASVLHDLGRLEEAEAEHRAEYEICRWVLGPEHPDTLISRNNLALVLSDLGRLEEAEAEGRAVLETRMRVLGPEHPNTLTSRNNLALVLSDLGRLEEAEAEGRAVLETRMRVLGPEHPNTLISRNNLASVLSDLGRLEEAEAEGRAVLETRMRVLGPEHPNTLISRNNLASVLSDLGRLEEAEAEHRAEYEICRRVLGAEHPDTLTSRNNLAGVLQGLGRLEEAEAEGRAVLETRMRVLGPEHPNTLIGRSNLAGVLQGLGRLEEAEAELRAVLETSTRVLGPEHPDTLISRNNLAGVLQGLGRLEEAEAELRAVLETSTRVLGPEHPNTLTSRNNLASVLHELGRRI